MGKLNITKAKDFIAPFFAIVSTLLAACLGAFILIDVAKMNAAWLFLPCGILQAAMMVLHDVVFAEPGLRLRPALIKATMAPAESSLSQASVPVSSDVPAMPNTEASAV